jgi:hypothetical protein
MLGLVRTGACCRKYRGWLHFVVNRDYAQRLTAALVRASAPRRKAAGRRGFLLAAIWPMICAPRRAATNGASGLDTTHQDEARHDRIYNTKKINGIPPGRCIQHNKGANAVPAEIIDLFTHRRSVTAIGRSRRPVQLTAIAGQQSRRPARVATTIAGNERLRSVRRDAWRDAEAATGYWRALGDFTFAVYLAKRHGVKEARAHAETSCADRLQITDNHAAALARQLLTPAPDMAAVNWKRCQLKRGCRGVSKGEVAKVIADDIAFLDAHPTRNSRANQLRKGKIRS